MKSEAELRDDLCLWGRSFFQRGLTSGSSGNLSVRLPDGGFLTTPTNACLGCLSPERLSRLDARSRHIAGDAPTKEVPLHMAFYAARAQAGAVVHLHSTYATALSCLRGIDPANVLAPITPYAVMRIGRLPLLPYAHPGSDMGPMVREVAKDHVAVLLANHGPVVSGATLEAAVYAAEELEETAKLLFVLRGHEVKRLTLEQVAELEARFDLRGKGPRPS